MDDAGIILDLGILKITFVWLYFFTKSIDKLINITARQGMSKIQSFLEIKKRWIRWKIKHILWISMILFLYCILWQYRLWSFQSGGTKSERVLPKNQHTQKKVFNFENWTNGEVSKSAKIWLSNSIFYVKNQLNLSQFFFIEGYQFRSTFFASYIFW